MNCKTCTNNTIDCTDCIEREAELRKELSGQLKECQRCGEMEILEIDNRGLATACCPNNHYIRVIKAVGAFAAALG